MSNRSKVRFRALVCLFSADQLRELVEHGITGDILIHLDHEALKDVGIHSVVRLLCLKATGAC